MRKAIVYYRDIIIENDNGYTFRYLKELAKNNILYF